MPSQEATDGQPQTASEDSSAAGGNVGLMEELQVVRSERDRAVREEKSLRQSVTLLKQQKEVGFIQVCFSIYSGIDQSM